MGFSVRTVKIGGAFLVRDLAARERRGAERGADRAALGLGQRCEGAGPH